MSSESKETSQQVVYAVARAKGVKPETLPPLYEAVNPDALDALFDRTTTARRNDDGPMVRFSYAGRTVIVRSAIDVEVRQPSDEASEK